MYSSVYMCTYGQFSDDGTVEMSSRYALKSCTLRAFQQFTEFNFCCVRCESASYSYRHGPLRRVGAHNQPTITHNVMQQRPITASPLDIGMACVRVLRSAPPDANHHSLDDGGHLGVSDAEGFDCVVARMRPKVK